MYAEWNIKEISHTDLERAERLLKELNFPLVLEQSSCSTDGVLDKQGEWVIRDAHYGIIIEDSVVNFLLEAPEILSKCLKSIEAYRRQEEADWERSMGDDL